LLLEGKPDGKLYRTRGRRAGDLAKCSAADVRIRVVKFGVIEQVEEFRAEFDRSVLGNSKLFGKSRVLIGPATSTNAHQRLTK